VSVLEILVVDDDPEVIRQLEALLPDKLAEDQLLYQFETDFEAAVAMLARRRFDILISDIYVARETKHKTPIDADIKARELLAQIRGLRACPIILITDGQLPDEFKGHPFVATLDKGSAKFTEDLENTLAAMLETGIPGIARKLHEELDRHAGSYLWGFLEKNWQRLKDDPNGFDQLALERVVRRRAAFQLARLTDNDGTPQERQDADPCDYYIMPPIGSHLRLGEILRHKEDGSLRVVLTPHCHLVTQPNRDRPRADYLLTLKTVPAAQLLQDKPWGSNPGGKLRTRSSIPARDVGLPEERYCFLPGFLDVPDLYCDLMQTEAVAFADIGPTWERVAALDTPFAEALQSSFAKLFGAVGLPLLNTDRVKHLVQQPPATEGITPAAT
jgi:CheY-like chemotaxis protein